MMNSKKGTNIEHLLSVRPIEKNQNIVSVLRKVMGNLEREDTEMKSQLAKECMKPEVNVKAL